MKKRNQTIYASYSDRETSREKENREIAYNAACESIVLLKNDGALPLKDKRVALFGSGVSHTVKGGTGSGEVNERHAVSIYEGMENAGFEITTADYLKDYEELYSKEHTAWENEKPHIKDIVSDALKTFLPPYGRLITDEDIAKANCDSAIYVISRQAGEGKDKRLENKEFDLEDVEIRNIEKITGSFKYSILVINSGSYLDIGTLDEKVSAVIFLCQQGMEGGRAFADIVSGNVNPSGKLTDSWAKSYSDIPFGDEYSYLGDAKNQYYKEGIYVGYKYYDAFNVSPRYRFGFGLSYTTFDIKAKEITSSYVKADVTNTGDMAGKEVVMLFARNDCLRLIGFAKTDLLEKGESQEVTIGFTPDYLAIYDEKEASYVIPAGEIPLYIGYTEIGAIVNDGKKVVSVLTNLTSPGIEEIKPAAGFHTTGSKVRVQMHDIETQYIEYGEIKRYESPEVDKVLSSLTRKDMADLCVGEGLIGMVKSTGNYAPGTVGRTTDGLFDKGLVNVNLSDGPAGLRLLLKSGLSKNGKLRFADECYQNIVLKLMPVWVRKVFGASDKDKILYQFTTAFPVETALAQTWNEALCEQVGKAISREMEEYGITYWLAPAVNIHKNPLCGRNFEYMSEDPVLSGKMASALIRGVQSIEGNYATVKHFACNNSEDERNHMNSIVNEKALREIYLRAFEICVKEGKVKSVMTSYNKLNGTYTAQNAELCIKVLRNEWGFDGVVMTDWFSTNKGQADAAKAIEAGNDMIMPGMKSDKKAILAETSEESLKKASANIIRQILNSRVNRKTE